jgi:hypothetical protein
MVNWKRLHTAMMDVRLRSLTDGTKTSLRLKQCIVLFRREAMVISLHHPFSLICFITAMVTRPLQFICTRDAIRSDVACTWDKCLDSQNSCAFGAIFFARRNFSLKGLSFLDRRWIVPSLLSLTWLRTWCRIFHEEPPGICFCCPTYHTLSYGIRADFLPLTSK